MFEKLFRKSQAPLSGPRIQTKLHEISERGAWLHAALASSHWKEAHAFLEKSRDDSDYPYLIEVASDWPGRPRWFEPWLEACPDSPIPWLVSGAHLIHWAWEARGGKRATNVEEDAWPDFFARLEASMESLARSAALCPEDAMPFSYMIAALTGLDATVDERRQALDEALRRNPEHLPAHFNAVMAFSEKWGGSHDLLFEFARSTSRRKTSRSPLHGLVACAHVERWLYYSFEDDQAGMETYFAENAVRVELRSVFGRFGDHPEPDTRYLTNSFAFAFYMSGDHPEARSAFKQTRGFVTGIPWCYLGKNTAENYTAALRAVS